MTEVSVIIPSYRQPHFLGTAIRSCLDQDFQDLEVIVVEDRSRDASLAIARSFARRDARVRVVEAGENGGLGRARNIGIAHASGTYLCFLDSDDYLLPDSIRVRIEAFPAAVEEFGDSLAGVYGDWLHVGEDVDEPELREPRRAMPIVSDQSYTGENVFICSAPLVRRDLVLEAGGFPEGLPMLEDFALWARMISAGAIFAPVSHLVATYRQRPNSMLRGDGVVVMADYVDVINQWVAGQGVDLADSGALDAWLEDRPPMSFGRMSWNVPSVLGSYGAAAGSTPAPQREAAGLASGLGTADFMAAPITVGLGLTSESDAQPEPTVDSAVLVGNLRHALEAVEVVARMRDDGRHPCVVVDDPVDWATFWPAELADVSIRDRDVLNNVDLVVDLSTPGHVHADSSDLARLGADRLWPEPGERGGAIVYVTDELAGHPGIDAWVSVALHAIAAHGSEPTLMASPKARASLGGWRATLLSLGDILESELVIAPTVLSAALMTQLAPTIVFNPFGGVGDAHTAAELSQAITDRM